MQYDSSVSTEMPPGESRIVGIYGNADLADAYAVRLPDNAVADPELLARFVFGHQASWVAGLMRIRDALVAGFGIKTSKQLQSMPESGKVRRIRFFRIYETDAREIVLGEDDKHLDFRLSVLLQTRDVSGASARYLVLSTVVHCHNRLGRAYILLIAPFHRWIARSSLRSAARAGWPTC